MKDVNMKEVTTMKEEREFKAPHDNPHHKPHHKPHHERRPHVELGEMEWEVFFDMFKNEETANAAMACIYKAPAEMQNIVIQIFHMMKDGYKIGEKLREKTRTTSITNVRWKNPFLENADEVYEEVYGDGSKTMVDIYEESPIEISVISRLLTYMYCKREGVMNNGYCENN